MMLAAKIAEILDVPLTDPRLRHFPDGEINVKIEDSMRGHDVFVIQPTSPPVNEHLMELFIILDALRRASAGRVTAVIPYYGYARKERKTQPREPISAKLIANFITLAGADRLLLFDLHAEAIEGFFDVPTDHLSPHRIFAEYLKGLHLKHITIVAPDAGGGRRAEAVANDLGAPIAFGYKRRPDEQSVEVIAVSGDVKGRDCVVVEDIITTGSTVSKLAAALASGTETALTSVGRLRVRHLAEQGSQAAAILQRLRADPNRFLSTVLFTNTLALIIASTATALMTDSILTRADVPSAWRLVGTLLVSLVLSIVLLIVAEVTPKTLAISQAERWALAAAGPVDRVASFLIPILWAVTIISRGITGGRAARALYLTEEELLTVLHVSDEQGVIEEQEHQMIHGIIEIGDKTVREVMIPRTDIVAVDREDQLRDLVKLFKEYRHTRMPVYENNIDHVIGLINCKDLLLFYTLSSSQKFDIDKILRPILYVPEQKKVDELLNEMRVKKQHMMVVVDEYGGTAGLVTLEDLLEEIVGEIRDEYDTAEQDQLQILTDHEARVDAGFPLEELNERLHLGLEESGDYDSVGGYVHAMLGKIAEEGDSFQAGRAKWIVEKVKGRRIESVRLTAEEPWPTDNHGHGHDGSQSQSEAEERTGHLS